MREREERRHGRWRIGCPVGLECQGTERLQENESRGHRCLLWQSCTVPPNFYSTVVTAYRSLVPYLSCTEPRGRPALCSFPYPSHSWMSSSLRSPPRYRLARYTIQGQADFVYFKYTYRKLERPRIRATSRRSRLFLSPRLLLRELMRDDQMNGL